MKRVILIVLDSFGIGEAPDAAAFGDEGSNTLASVSGSPLFHCPNLKKLGLFNIDGVEGCADFPMGSFARMKEASMGKDTTIGHWEIAGLISPEPLPVYPRGFPKEVIERFECETGRKTLCNLPYSGTEVIKDYGLRHIATGDLIVYTSADSVFQIAAHEDVVPVRTLYSYCEIARRILTGKNAVGRVIARPFAGDYPFVRTAGRHDFSLSPGGTVMPVLLQKAGVKTVSVGKIYDIFAGCGFDEFYRTSCNDDGIKKTVSVMKSDSGGLVFVNLVDFDSSYGHRNDTDGYAKALSEFDLKLADIMAAMKKDDVLILTADHGCDPGTPSTDHSREFTPMLIYGDRIRSGINLGTRQTFADISASVLDYFGVDKEHTAGQSFLPEVLK